MKARKLKERRLSSLRRLACTTSQTGKSTLLCILLLASLRASAETLAETVARYEKLGMPNVAGAEYVHIADTDGYRNKRIIDLGGCGNAWKISDETTADGLRIATFVINGAEIIRYRWEVEKWWNTQEAEPWAEWENARLKRAVLQIMRVLEDHVERSKKTLTRDQQHAQDMEDIYNKRVKFNDTLTPGHFYLFALQLHQRGETQDAETLAQQLVEIFGADVIEASARVALAEAFYRTAYWKFCVTKDWKQFCDEVQNVLDGAPQEWAWRSDLREMLARLQFIARGESAPLPQGHAFSEEERALIQNWEATPDLSTSLARNTVDFPDILWLVPESWLGRLEHPSKAEEKIRALGLKAFPMLVAISGEFPQDNPYKGYAFPFPHPLLRAEKARETLGKILPKTVSDKAGWEITKNASAYYRQNKDLSEESLALQYVVGAWSINKKPFEYLRKRAESKRIPEWEAFFREVPFDSENYGRDELVYKLTENVIYYATLHKDEKLLRDYADRLDVFAGECKEIHTHGKNGWHNRHYSKEDTEKIQSRLRKDAEKLRAMAAAIAENGVLELPTFSWEKEEDWDDEEEEEE